MFIFTFKKKFEALIFDNKALKKIKRVPKKILVCKIGQNKGVDSLLI